MEPTQPPPQKPSQLSLLWLHHESGQLSPSSQLQQSSEEDDGGATGGLTGEAIGRLTGGGFGGVVPIQPPMQEPSQLSLLSLHHSVVSPQVCLPSQLQQPSEDAPGDDDGDATGGLTVGGFGGVVLGGGGLDDPMLEAQNSGMVPNGG